MSLAQVLMVWFYINDQSREYSALSAGLDCHASIGGVEWVLEMRRFTQKWHAFHADESGQDMIEYALVVALIGLGAIVSMKSLANSINNFWYQSMAKIAAVWPS